MIVKFFRHGNTQKGKSGRTSGGNSVRDYLLGKDKQRENATLIRGNADQTTEVINNITNKSIYTSGVLSFSKDEQPTDNQIEEIIDSYENTLFPNMDKDQYSSYWVRHEDKDRTELHFVFANIELKTGKALPVYYHRNDKNLVDSWKNLVNDKYGFIDPNAPINRKQLTPTTRNEQDNAQKDSIHERILSYVERNRSINSRDDVVKAIENLGYEVTRTSKKDDSISIKNPQGGRNLKLKGELYSPNFSRDKLPDHQIHAQIYYDKERESRINEQRAKYEHNLSLREKRLTKRFGEIDRTPTDPKLTQELAKIRAENEPIFLENIAKAEKQAKEKVIIAKQVTQLDNINQSNRAILSDETYQKWEKLIPERLEEKRNHHVSIANSIYGKAQNQLLEPSELEQFKKSLDSIYTIDDITAKRQAELEQAQRIHDQLAFIKTIEKEIFPNPYYEKWEQLTTSQLDYNRRHYTEKDNAIIEKAHHEILEQSDIDDHKSYIDVIATIDDITAKRELERLEQLRAEQAKIKFDNQIKAQLDTLASVTGKVTQSLYDSLRTYEPSELDRMTTMHTRLIDRTLDTAGREIIADFNNDLDRFTQSKNILVTIDRINYEREQARLAEQKRVAEMVKKPPIVTPKPPSKPSAQTTPPEQNKPPVERVSVADDRNARLTQAQKIIADFDKLVKDNAEKLKTATVKDRIEKFNKASKALTDLGSKPLFRGKDQWEIDNKKLTLNKRNAEISLDQAKGDTQKLQAWNFKLELFREKQLQPINYTAIALERLDESVKNKVEQARDVIEKINDEINREQAKPLGADRLARNGESYYGRIVEVNEKGVYQQVGNELVLHDHLSKGFKLGDMWSIDYTDTEKTNQIKTQQQMDLSRYITGKSQDKGQER